MTLSFIIPAYNASETIIRTLDSICNLALQKEEYEIIVIDDCSIDNTRELVREYSLNHSQVRLLCQPQNHRQGAARNRGINEAKGEYIMLVDADDKVEDGVPHALGVALKTKVDCLFCNYLWMYSDTNVEHRKLPLEDGFVCSGLEFCEKYYETIINTCPISYLWKRAYLLQHGVPFIEDRRMEDFDWIERNVYGARTVGNTTAIIYRVLTYENLQSTTHICSPETSADWAHVSYRRWLFCDEICHNAPQFAANIEFQCRCFVSNVLKIRNISKFSIMSVKRLYDRIGYDAISYFISKGGWKKETQICLKHPYLVMAMDLFMYPIASFGRYMVQLVRKKKKI